MSHQEKPFDPTKPVVLSTGPRTEAGKAISSRNAMKHGCCSDETLIIPGRETSEDFEALQVTWQQAYSPRNAPERHLIQALILADWFLQRATRTLAEVEHNLFVRHPDPLDWDEDLHRKLARFQRYQTARANHFHKCRKAMEDYRKHRTTESQLEEKKFMAHERHELYKQKNRPQPTVQELIQNMLREKREREEQERLAQPPTMPDQPEQV